ncbi:MAG: c-type cytochrome [Cyclobacteriaceae bacterium]
MNKLRIALLPGLVFFSISMFPSSNVSAQASKQQTPWVAPAEADTLTNPLTYKEVALKRGKELYTAECVVCHGTYGNAETNIAETLEQKPKNFTKEDFLTQSDGSIFWKLSEGRGLMQPFKTMLTDEEIWCVVSYIKVLAGAED